MKIFLDMDGVIVDFVRPALAAHGKTLPMSEVRWNFPGQVGMTDKEFWPKLGYDFWSSLPRTNEANALLGYLLGAHKDNLALLSSPCNTRGCRDGKHTWVINNVPQLKDRLILGSCKEMFAHYDSLLIDDHEKNVDKFRAYGGSAILVPRPWNSRRAECDEDGNVADVEDLLWSIWCLTGGKEPNE